MSIGWEEPGFLLLFFSRASPSFFKLGLAGNFTLTLLPVSYSKAFHYLCSIEYLETRHSFLMVLHKSFRLNRIALIFFVVK